MARASRSRTRRSSSTKRPLDWVTGPSTYNMYLPPAILNVNSGPDAFNLTAWPDLIGTGAAFGDPDMNSITPWLEQTVVRVRGEIWAWILPTTAWWSTLTGRAAIKARIVKGLQPTDSGPNAGVVETQQPFSPRGGNVEFLWEKTFIFIAQSSWGDLTVDPASYVQKVEVDVRVQRRLQRNECLMLQFDYIGIDYSGDLEAFPDAAVDFELRTLLRTIT